MTMYVAWYASVSHHPLCIKVLINVGIRIEVMPVIGLTMPLISYGGSSVVTIFAMLGLVSSAYTRP